MEIPADEFAARLEALRGPIKAVLRTYGIPPADAEDVMQEVFLVVARRWHSIASFETFTIGVTRYTCLNWLTRNLHKRSRESSFEELDLELAISPEQTEVERAVRLQQLLAPLRPNEREALRLRSLGLSPQKIAAALGLAESSIRKICSRGVKRIKALQAETQKPTARRKA